MNNGNGNNGNINRIDYYPIFNAIREDDAKTLMNIMLEGNIDPNNLVYGQAPLLIHALIYNRSPKAANALFSLGADPNIYFEYFPYRRMTPLMAATHALNPDAVRILLKNGANPELKSNDDYRQSVYDFIKADVDKMNNTAPMEVRDRMQKIAKMLHIDPKELRSAKRALKPHTRNIMGSLSVRGRLPASVVGKEILPFLSTKYTRKRQGSPKSSRSPKSSTRRTSL
jgi:hypothetical protein